MQSRLDGGAGMRREKIGRRLQSDGFNAAFDEPFVGGQGGKAAGFIHAQFVAAFVGDFLKIIGHGMRFITTVLLKELGNPGAAAAVADYAQFDLAFEFGWGSRSGGLCGQGFEAGDGGGSGQGVTEEAAAINGEIVFFVHNWRMSLCADYGELVCKWLVEM